MGLIPPDSLEAIRSKLDIAELVIEYVSDLKPSGRNLKGRCPFHQERTPSFYVNPERQTFHCFGCGVGGDAFAFLMKIENLNFSEAVEKLAARTGVEIARGEALGPQGAEKIKLKEILSFAADFYHEILLNSRQAQGARDYFAKRKVSAESVEAFKLGYAPGGGLLVEAAGKKGYAPELLLKSGLAAPNKNTGKLRDYFYERVLFPIRDAKGSVVGFGGRIMGEGEPKYLNSPESAVFSKGRVLYGLYEGLAAVRKFRKAILMEGYMDVIAAHQYGFTLACAPLGTALTPDHAALLKRYASSVALVFDADKAGQTAAVRGAEILVSAGFDVRVAAVPEGKDPDEYLHQQGAAAFKSECLGKALDPVESRTEKLLEAQAKPLSPEAKAAIAKEVLAVIARGTDEVLKGEWMRRLAQRLDVAEDSLRKEITKVPKARQPFAAERLALQPLPLETADLPQDDAHLLSPILRKPELAALVTDNDFISESGRKICKTLLTVKGEKSWPALLLQALAEPEHSFVSRLLMSELGGGDPAEALTKLLQSRRAAKRIMELEPLIREMGAGKRPKNAELQEEYKRLCAQTKSHQG